MSTAPTALSATLTVTSAIAVLTVDGGAAAVHPPKRSPNSKKPVGMSTSSPINIAQLEVGVEGLQGGIVTRGTGQNRGKQVYRCADGTVDTAGPTGHKGHMGYKGHRGYRAL